MNFHDVRFPAALSFGSLGGPERRTEVVTLANGFEERNTPWAHSRRRYDAGVGLRSLEDVETMIAFFEARQGQLYGFRWKDWSDYRSCAATAQITYGDQIIARGDGETAQVQLIKCYRSGEACYGGAHMSALQEHLQEKLTSVARCWALTRRDGRVFGFTDHDRELSFDGIVFRADSGMTARVLEQVTGLAVDNTEAIGARAGL